MTVQTWKARPTTYRGIEMRSRLEAGYAAILDGMAARTGITWDYEPQAFGNERGQYLPDFVIHDSVLPPIYIEVKPTVEKSMAAMTRMQIIWDSYPDAWLWIECPDGQFEARGKDRAWTWAPWPSPWRAA